MLMLKLCITISLIGVGAPIPAATHRGMAPDMMQDGSVSNDGADYSRVGSKEHVWFERVPDDADAPGSATGYWLDDALNGPDHAACLDGTAPLYYHRPGSGSGKDKWYIHHEVGQAFWCCLMRLSGLTLHALLLLARGAAGESEADDGALWRTCFLRLLTDRLAVWCQVLQSGSLRWSGERRSRQH